MRRLRGMPVALIVAVGVFTLLASAVLVAGGVGRAAVHSPSAACPKGSVAAVIAGKRVCLKAGLPCDRRRGPAYLAYGFACPAGRLTQLWQMTDLGTFRGQESEAKLINERGHVVGEGGVEPFFWQDGKMTALGTIAGTPGSVTFVHSMNDNGQVVGFSEAATGDMHAFLWQNGKMTDLGTLGGSSSEALGINNNGQVVGYSLLADSETAAGSSHAFLWQNGKMTDLGTLGGSSSEAIAINNNGQVVGASDTATGESHAFLWQNGKMTDLGKPAGTYESSATMINDEGQIVGFARHAQGQNHVVAYWVLWQTGKMTVLPGAGDTSVSAINNRGQIVGSRYTAAGRAHAFIWQNGKMTDLGTFGSPQSWGAAINDHGQVAGYLTGGDTNHPFVWENGKVTILSEGEAAAINDRGQIAGYTDTAAGHHAVFWTLRPSR